MTHTETIRNTILVFAIVLLAYTLYRRLLVILRRDAIALDYPKISNAIKWTDSRQAIIEVEIGRGGDIRLEVFKANGELVDTLAETTIKRGSHTFPLNTNGYTAGRYYYRITADKQQASQYFTVE